MKKNKRDFISKHELFYKLQLKTRVMPLEKYRQNLEAGRCSKEDKQRLVKEHEKKIAAEAQKQERLTAFLADRKPDDFSEWYLSQTPDIQNEIRIFAADRFQFPGQFILELLTTQDYLNKGHLAPPTVRYNYEMKFRVLLENLIKRDMKDEANKLERAKRRYVRKHAGREHWIDAGLAAAFLGKSKRTFFTFIKNGTYSFTKENPNDRVVKYDGNEVLDRRLKELLAAK